MQRSGFMALAIGAAACLCAPVAIPRSAPQLRNAAVANGGHTVSDASGRFVLSGTVAEPVQGVVSDPAQRFRLTAGFPATLQRNSTASGTDVFADGFETAGRMEMSR